MKKPYVIICGTLAGVIAALSLLLVFYYQTTYTVTFDTKGGTIYRSVEVRPNATVTPPLDPVMEGYIFAGWFAEGANQNTDDKYNFDKKVTEDITIVAKWIPIIEDSFDEK